ncbi:shikimate kinase [Flagellimonas lutaonensis]|uniref:Shikimate kinase n=1 Tax=Flagellimonas lutaonensis TaxID=516051 RepID=A0A0D5YUC9_9FLAO|nr:shikimate kinase [Allomuricauda lutaonensis]AKA35942.1 shikimate kinase [Allomuricauda lutaonensis]
MQIVLLGYMGSGKSTIGRSLSEDLNIEFIDLDTAIEQKIQQPIPEIFKERGEIFFRKKETEVLASLLNENKDMVLATGGGTPCYSTNMENILKSGAISIYLKVSIPELVDRIALEQSERPLVSHLPKAALPEFIGKHLFERTPFYDRADHTVVCDGKSPAEIIQEIKVLI